MRQCTAPLPARGSAALAAAALMFASLLTAQAHAADDAIILDAERYVVQTGRYSVFSKFQERLQRALGACGKPEPPVVPAGQAPAGKFGLETSEGIIRALDCPGFERVPSDSPARKGVLTQSVWSAIMGAEPAPSVEDRAHALVLSFEATDFGDKPEWNLCQDGQRGQISLPEGRSSDFECYNASDPCSFLTWGPRGATAGAGREIQWILWVALKRDPALVERAFGAEFPNLERFFHLRSAGSRRNCSGDIPLKVFLCAIWADPSRHAAWDHALAELGHAPVVRAAYTQIYASKEFDGANLKDYFHLWTRLHLPPSEVDYAFFLDRVTHQGEPPDETDDNIEALSSCIRHEDKALNAHGAARRCLARFQPHETQPENRLARDVGFYLDAYPEGVLSEKEVKTWAGYVPLSAVHNFGLSDSVAAHLPELRSVHVIVPDAPHANSSRLTDAERNACPASVLSPIRSKPPG